MARGPAAPTADELACLITHTIEELFMRTHCLVLLAAALSAAISFTALADAPAMPPSIQTGPTTNPDYEATITKRANDIIALLDLTEEARITAVREIITTQYRSLNAWHDANDKRRDELRKIVGKSFEPTPDKLELDKINASLDVIHNWYLTQLGTQLTPEQIRIVKDKMVYGKVQVTYLAYLSQNPTLTEEHKMFILEELILAREAGMDGGSSHEKDVIFDKFKGRINNYLSKNGYGKKKPSTSASTQPAK